MSLEDLKQSLSEFYHSLDEKAPNLPLVLGIGLIVLIAVAGILFFTQGKETVDYTIMVENAAGVPVRGAEVIITGLKEELKLSTGTDGKVTFTAEAGKEVEVAVSKQNYGTEKKTLAVEKGGNAKFVLKAPDFVVKEVTFTFVGPDSKKLVGKEVLVKLSCSGTGTFTEDEYKVESGELTVSPPENCGRINVSAQATGFLSSSATVLGNSQVIQFKGIEKPKGSVEVRAKDSETGRFADGIRVKLVDSAGSPTLFSGTTSFGEVSFAGVEIGTYTVIAEDPTGQYANESVAIEVEANFAARKELLLSKDVKLRAKITVKEKNGPALQGAKVTLRTQAGMIVAEPATQTDGSATILVKDHGSYTLEASKSEYLPGQKVSFATTAFAKGSEKLFTIELAKCTAQTCGLLKVRVVDENAAPVENAKVSILGDGEFVESAYGTKTTDFNGHTQPFTGVAKGTYTLLAQKFPAEARSETINIDPAGQNYAEVKLIIGTGMVKVAALDSDKKPVEFGSAEIFTDYGQRLGTISLDAKGEGTLKVKADKRVFAVVRKDGFAKYVTVARQVLPEKTITLGADMEKTISGTKPAVEFLGVYSQGKKVASMKAGEEYTAKFILRVPRGTTFDKAGLFVRAGGSGSVEADNIWVKEISAPLSAQEKGASYNPPKGKANNGGEEAAEGDKAKWVSAVWDKPEEGKYEAEATLMVRRGTTKGSTLLLNFRAWGAQGTKYLRDPADSVLVESLENAQKLGLYAESYEKSFLEGIDELCDTAFCFSARLFDETAGIYIEPPYKVRTFSPYRLEFSLMNNSETMHSNAGIAIRNTRDGPKAANDISIDSYTFENANSQSFSGTKPAYDLEQLFLGDFRQNRSVSGKLNLQAKAATASAIEFKVVSNQTNAFTKLVQFTPYFEDDVTLEVKPEALVAFVPLELEIKAAYAAGEKKGFGVEEADIIIRRIAPDRSESIVTGKTGKDGVAKITVPASSPGTRLVIRAEKSGLAGKTIEKEISPDAALFTPKEIKVSLNRGTKPEARTELVIQNLIGKPVKIKRLRSVGNFRGLLDERKMNNYLVQFAGAEIAGGKEKQVSVLTSLGPEAEALDRPLKVSGKLLVELALRDNDGIVWVSQLPFEAAVNLAELPENAPCIMISSKEWSDSTLSGRSTIEFEVQNNCISKDGGFAELQNLQGTIDWSGNDGVIGQVELTITDPEYGSVASEILQQGLWSRFSEKLSPAKVYAARLTFVPKADTLGKTAEFTVKIDAELRTNAGAELVGASNAIEGKIVVANLDQCIEIDPHPEQGLTIERRSDSAEFTIDTKKCGPIELDIRFCGGGKDLCRGGTKEGGILLKPWTYMRIREDTRTVNVERQGIPGFYGLTVEARPEGGSWKKVAEIDTIVEPEDGEYFTLDKYDFTVIGKGSKDYATLTNTMLQETVQVKANKCDWKEAEAGLSTGEKAAIGLAGAAAGAGVGYVAAVALSSGPIGAVIGLVVFVIILFMTLFGDDPCEQFVTNPVQDYVINLAGTADKQADRYIPPDAMDILMTNSKIKAEWNVNITDAVQLTNKNNKNGKQQVGAVFENFGVQQDEPVYAVATMRTKEHVHGDATHQNASVQCGTEGSEAGDFGQFWINPNYCGAGGRTYDTVYQQKFHLKFKVAEERLSLPKVSFDTLECQSGTEIGRTGKGALPRVKLDWSWADQPKGVGLSGCDAGNPDYVYCDAAQFTIELNKKLYRLYEFLQENRFDLGCPIVQDEKALGQEEVNGRTSSREVPAGAVGIRQAVASDEKGTIKLLVTARNNTNAEQDLTVRAGITSLRGFSGECIMEIKGIPANSEKQSTCSVQAAEEGVYALSVSVKDSSNAAVTDSGSIATGLLIGNPYASKQGDLCKLKTTETFAGVPHIMRFIEGKENIKWTASVPDKEALARLLIFDAYLMKDNYSQEFFRDFGDHYTNASFEDTDNYFHLLSKDTSGKNFGFNRLMERGNFAVTNKYLNTPEISGPGLYRVELAVYFKEDDWSFFEPNGEPRSLVAIVVHRKADAYPYSPFYVLPFDGLVGLKGDKYKRANYGVSYALDGEGAFTINNDPSPVKAFEDDGSNPVTRASVSVNRGLQSLNTSLGTRGMIMGVSNPGGKAARIVMQPSHATPVLLKVSKPELSDSKFSAFYGATENNSPVDVGNTLTYWDGAGACLDFSGVPASEAFYQKPDRAAKEGDRISDWKSVYALDWERGVKKGDVYLRTIFYSDPKKEVRLRSLDGGAKGTLYTPDGSGQTIGLNGVNGMKFNNFAAGSIGTIKSMSDVMEMVANGDVCVTNTGAETKFWWNPKSVYEADGKERNISKEAGKLQAGVSCIG